MAQTGSALNMDFGTNSEKNGHAEFHMVPIDSETKSHTGNGDIDDCVEQTKKNEYEPTQKWSDQTTKEKILSVLVVTAKFCGLLGFLYFFVCSLDLLSQGFRLIGGRTTGEIFQQDSLLQNPVVGIMIGVLTTVLVQSSSTSTSIIVSMVAADFLTVRVAIPIIMGANIGTSVTNTIVSLAQMGDREEFRRAFAAATIHDMFNWLSVLVLFPIEIITREIFPEQGGYLEIVSGAITSSLNGTTAEGGEIKLLSVITDPFTSLIVQIDKKVLEGWAKNDSAYYDASLIKRNCSSKEEVNGNRTSVYEPCQFLFNVIFTEWPDWAVGLAVLIGSLIVLCGCLICIVKILNSLLKGHIAQAIKAVVNADIPYVPWITGYLALIVGALMTFLVQSSSVFTSAITPLVGVQVLTIERAYPLTLGSNVGTTTTSVIAALAADPSKLQYTLQIALCHFFFNISGILLFYVVPFMRFPIPMAKFLGKTTAKYRWFSIMYLIGMFFVLPGAVLGLSIAGTIPFAIVGGLFLAIVTFVTIVKILQNKKPKTLPKVLRNWKFLPKWMRSLEPLDNVFARCICCRRFQQNTEKKESISTTSEEAVTKVEEGSNNLAFQD